MPGIEALEQFIPSFPILSAPWLVPPLRHVTSSLLVSTQVKQLKTTAPADMKGAKEKRVRERSEAKAKAKMKEGKGSG